MRKINSIFVLMLFISSSVFSQWNTGGNQWNAFGATNWNFHGNNNIRSIGIGHKQSFLVDGWTTDNPPRAALHINDFYLDDPPSWVFTPGQVFRTDGPSNQDNMWQMFTGNNYDNSTEKARLFVPANTNDFVVQASEIFGSIRFNLGGLQRMILRDGLGQVHVGIGNNFDNPQHMIHVHTTPLLPWGQPPSAMIGFTHNLTGSTATDGFLVGINSEGVAELRQWEDKDIILFTGAGTNNQSRMIIKGEEGDNKGFVGIGTDNPTSAFEVANGDIALTADNSGIILKAKDGENYYRILVDNNGTLYTEQVNIK